MYLRDDRMKITYREAINEALYQAMEADETVIVCGQGVTSAWYVGGTTQGLLRRFGPKRVIDTPVSENALCGAAVGGALAGLRPIYCFPRHDFALYAMDPIINQAAKWSYMFAGRANVPVVFWLIMNYGGSQGAQHSQDFTWIFERIPGLKVVNPQTPMEAKGYLTWAIREPNPVIFIDDRARYDKEAYVHPTLFSLQPPVIWNTTDCPVPASEVLERAYYSV